MPLLKKGALKIWDSLAIAEYLHELSPQAKLWPDDSEQRAIARSYAAEMHSGFASLRAQLSMDLQLKSEARHLSSQTIADIERILKCGRSLWRKARGLIFLVTSRLPMPFLHRWYFVSFLMG